MLGQTQKWLCKPPHHPPTETQCQQFLFCYWPDFDETLNVGSWEHLEQIPTVTGRFVQATITSNLTEIGTALPQLVLNFCSKLLFKTSVNNFCSQLLLTTFGHNLVHKFCWQVLLTNFFTSFVLNFWSQLLFKTFVHNFC